MRGAAERRQRSLQLGHFRPEHELAMRQHRLQPVAQRGAEARLLGRQVEEADRRVCGAVHLRSA